MSRRESTAVADARSVGHGAMGTVSLFNDRRCCWVGRRGNERGAAALEFALLMPLLLLVVFGTIQYGLYFWALQGGSDIARDAARQSAVGALAGCQEFRSHLAQSVESFNGFGESVTVERAYLDAAPIGVNVGDTVEIDVAFRSVDLHLPFLPFIDEGEVRTTVSARVENLMAAPEECLP